MLSLPDAPTLRWLLTTDEQAGRGELIFGSMTSRRGIISISERHEIKYPYSIRVVCALGHCRMRKSGVVLAFRFSVDSICLVDAISLKIDRQEERLFLRLRSPDKRPRPGFGIPRISRYVLGWRIICGLSS